MCTEYEIPLVLKVRANDESKAMHAAEGFVAAARRFNGAHLSLADDAAIGARRDGVDVPLLAVAAAS